VDVFDLSDFEADLAVFLVGLLLPELAENLYW
jgi:hypothetical protein